MNNTNRLAREWLFNHGADYIYFKPHKDTRKVKNKEVFFTKEGNFYMTDFFNLFDGFCYLNGIFTWLQTSTTNFHSEAPYREFLKDKKDCKILFLKAVKKDGKWEIKTKEIMQTIQPNLS